MITYQDFEKVKEKNNRYVLESFILSSINKHIVSKEYKTAADAETYDKQQNSTITNFTKIIYNTRGQKIVDQNSANNKICSNFFHRLNTQRCLYSLGNGVSFTNKKESFDDKGNYTVVDPTKDRLGKNVDVVLKKLGYKALIHGVSFGYWDFNKIIPFTLLEFIPLWDEYTGKLRAGIRFYRIDEKKPLIVQLYEEDGITEWIKEKDGDMIISQPKKGYIQDIKSTIADGIQEIEYSNYEGFPIVPLWGSQLKQSTLIGLKNKIDAYDLVNSGFANDLEDLTEIFWIISGAAGMTDRDIANYRRRLKHDHIATIDDEESGIQPYKEEIPYQARQIFLESIKNSIYEDFGALDVHTISATSTNDHIDAAYQPLDEQADDFEYQLIEFLTSILELLGIEDMPIFKRNRLSNQKEQTDMVLSAAAYLDTETILNKLPFISVDEIQNIIARKDIENGRYQEETAYYDINNEEEDEEDENKKLNETSKKE